MQYEPITSMDVESSFSMYENIPSDNIDYRVGFISANVEKCKVINSLFNLINF